jgi:hypothetical protein
MRTVIAVWCGLILSVWPAAGAEERHPPAKHPLLNKYRKKVLTPQAGARSAATAAINTARNYPHEWGTGPGGFAKRLGSSFGQHVVKGTIEMGVGALHHEDLSFQRSNLQGTWPRLKFAVKGTFIVPRTNKDGKTLAVGRIAGNMGAGVISRAWQPASAAGLGAGIASGGIGMGADVGVHVAREFWPRGKPKRRAGR